MTVERLDGLVELLTSSNPEETGALDESYELAREVGAELIIAYDPDADRLSAAIPDSAFAAGYRQLSGDEVGLLLGGDIASRLTGDSDGCVFANSIVSSRGLAAAAHAHDLRAVNTLTGFKWISRVPGLAFGYEKALCYCVDPTVVRDKDGYFATVPLSFRLEDVSLISEAMTRLRENPPTTLAGSPVVDHRRSPDRFRYPAGRFPDYLRSSSAAFSPMTTAGA